MAAELVDLAAALASELGDGWSGAAGAPAGWYSDQAGWLVGPDELCVRVSMDGWRKADRGRVFLAGVLPSELAPHSRGRVSDHEITVAGTKTAGQVAGDLRRRLLPELAVALAAARTAKAEHDAELAARRALLDEVAAALGPLGEVRRPGRDDQEVAAGRHSDTVTARVEVSRVPRYGAKVTFDVPRELLPTLIKAAVSTVEGQS